jgi:hypothetical protein
MSTHAIATPNICGEPPPAQLLSHNDERLKGELKGKAELLTRFVGDAALGGQIEISRNQIYASYPDADKARTDAYFSYMFCIVLFDPGNKQSPEEKKKAITEFRRQLQPGSSSTEEQPDHNKDALLEYVYSELEKTTRNLHIPSDLVVDGSLHMVRAAQPVISR